MLSVEEKSAHYGHRHGSRYPTTTLKGDFGCCEGTFFGSSQMATMRGLARDNRHSCLTLRQTLRGLKTVELRELWGEKEFGKYTDMLVAARDGAAQTGNKPPADQYDLLPQEKEEVGFCVEECYFNTNSKNKK